MAKQRGIHQIRGKIDNLSYYEQKYVRGGLIRRINAAMSERLKTDPAFANTRIANRFFGGCSLYASVLLSSFGSRNIYLHKPYRQALLTKILFDTFRISTNISDYESAGFTPNTAKQLPFVIDNITKVNFASHFPSVKRFKSNLELGSSYDFELPVEELEAYCDKYKCDSVQISISGTHYLYQAYYDAASDRYIMGDYSIGGRNQLSTWKRGDGDFTSVVQISGSDDCLNYFCVFISPVIASIGGRNITARTGSTFTVISFTGA